MAEEKTTNASGELSKDELDKVAGGVGEGYPPIRPTPPVAPEPSNTSYPPVQPVAPVLPGIPVRPEQPGTGYPPVRPVPPVTHD